MEPSEQVADARSRSFDETMRSDPARESPTSVSPSWNRRRGPGLFRIGAAAFVSLCLLVGAILYQRQPSAPAAEMGRDGARPDPIALKPKPDTASTPAPPESLAPADAVELPELPDEMTEAPEDISTPSLLASNEPGTPGHPVQEPNPASNPAIPVPAVPEPDAPEPQPGSGPIPTTPSSDDPGLALSAVAPAEPEAATIDVEDPSGGTSPPLPGVLPASFQEESEIADDPIVSPPVPAIDAAEQNQDRSTLVDGEDSLSPPVPSSEEVPPSNDPPTGDGPALAEASDPEPSPSTDPVVPPSPAGQSDPAHPPANQPDPAHPSIAEEPTINARHELEDDIFSMPLEPPPPAPNADVADVPEFESVMPPPAAPTSTSTSTSPSPLDESPQDLTGALPPIEPMPTPEDLPSDTTNLVAEEAEPPGSVVEPGHAPPAEEMPGIEAIPSEEFPISSNPDAMAENFPPPDLAPEPNPKPETALVGSESVGPEMVADQAVAPPPEPEQTGIEPAPAPSMSRSHPGRRSDWVPIPSAPLEITADDHNRPGRSENEPPRTGFRTHVVGRGENFWTISRTYYGDGRYYQALWEANRDRVPVIDELYIDTELVIPPLNQLVQQTEASVQPPSDPRLEHQSFQVETDRQPIALALPIGRERSVVAETRPRIEAKLPPTEPEPRLHIVEPNETLRSLARDILGDPDRYEEIYRLNRDRIRNPRHLAPGIVLRLPEP